MKIYIKPKCTLISLYSEPLMQNGSPDKEIDVGGEGGNDGDGLSNRRDHSIWDDEI